MKTLVHSIRSLPQLAVNPLSRTAMPFFFALAFLPGVLRLALPDFSATNLLAALCPVGAAFWLAASFRELRLNFVMLGTLSATLLWAVNWLILAGHSCCSTMN